MSFLNIVFYTSKCLIYFGQDATINNNVSKATTSNFKLCFGVVDKPIN